MEYVFIILIFHLLFSTYILLEYLFFNKRTLNDCIIEEKYRFCNFLLVMSLYSIIIHSSINDNFYLYLHYIITIIVLIISIVTSISGDR